MTSQTSVKDFLKVKLWGVRGELPASPNPFEGVSNFKNFFTDFFNAGFSSLPEVDSFIATHNKSHWGGYSVNTTCVEVTSAKAQLIIEGGSGLKSLGDSMLKGPAGKGQGMVHLFISDFEWENLIGLPFFTPIFIPNNEIHFYSISKEIETNIKSIFSKPYFPVDFKHLMSKISFHCISPGETLLFEDLEIKPLLSSNQNESHCNYKIINKTTNKSYIHNSSPYSLDLKELLQLQNCDLMYSSLNQSDIEILISEAEVRNVQKLLLGKYKMDQTTSVIEKIDSELKNKFTTNNKKIWSFALQDQEIEL